MNWFQFALVMVLETTIYGHYTSLTLQDPSATVNPRKKYVDDIPNLLPGLEGPVASAAAGGVDEAEDMEVAWLKVIGYRRDPCEGVIFSCYIDSSLLGVYNIWELFMMSFLIQRLKHQETSTYLKPI